MKSVFRPRLAVLALSLVTAVSVPVATAQAPSIQGIWQSGDSKVRITVNKTEAKAVFTEVGTAARGLGFKSGETSFAATVLDNYLHGEQIIKYGGRCHPNGRKVPMIARLAPNGRILAIHNYNVAVDPNCRDTGEYTVAETLWQRLPGR
jgi:hypothetical protein